MRNSLRGARGISLLALATAVTAPAWAGCVPPEKGQTSLCDSIDDDGIILSAPDSTLTIAAGGAISSSAGPAILAQRQGNNYPSDTNSIVVNVEGSVTGIGQDGVTFEAGDYDYRASDSLIVNVAAGGSVNGATGIRFITGSGYQYASMNLTLNNDGSVIGDDGYAVFDSTDAARTYSQIRNGATGVMGAISGQLGLLDNAGLIDGGLHSAVDARVIDYAPQAIITNNGRILSASATATIERLGANAMLTNSGTIANSGSGSAVDGHYYTVVNEAGGLIKGGSTTAIGAVASLQLTNAGIIDGNVVIQSAPENYYIGSRVDSTGGVINGDLVFGGSADTLVTTFDASGLHTGVTGTIDGGLSNYDTIEVQFTADQKVDRAISLPGFERLALVLQNGVTVTLNDGFALNAPLMLRGDGLVVNQTDLSFTGSDAITNNGDFSYSIHFRNEGHIAIDSLSNGRAMLFGHASVDNVGSIDMVGNGLSFSSGLFTNSGSITATGRAVNVQGSGSFSNSGSIRSTGDVALLLDYTYLLFQNSGLIDGAKAAVQLNGNLQNTGTLSSARTAVVMVGGGLMNDVGGVISGGEFAIGPQEGFTLIAGSVVANAGTINGNVMLANDSPYSGYGNSYIALAGGILNGDLTLGRNDLLAIDLPAAGGAPFTGINGAVNANGAELRFRAASDASAAITPVAGFGTVSYEVLNGATLNLSADQPLAMPLKIAGVGTIDLTADMSVGDEDGLVFTTPVAMPGEGYSTSELTVISHGTLSALRTAYGAYPTYGALIALGYNDSFTNDGTIIFRTTMAADGLAAVRGGVAFVNDGTILLDGTTAYSGSAWVENHGTITEVAGGAPSQGVANAALVNSGTISVTGTAVISGATVENSGLLRSTGGAAISANYGVTLTNLAGGTVQGNGVAIRAGTSRIVNAGLILGTVDLSGASPYYGSLFVSDGGTVQGDMLFGAGDDIFMQNGDTAGVTGIIDGGAGIDTYGRTFSASTTVDLDPVPGLNFERQLIRASGTDTVLTLQSTQSMPYGLLLGGDGSIVNRTQTSSTLSTYIYPDPIDIASDTLTAFTNEADIGGFFGRTHSFSNKAVIDSSDAGQPAAYLEAADSFAFANSGQIGSQDDIANAVSIYGSSLTSFSFQNDGAINGRVEVGINLADGPVTASFVNSGTIESASEGGLTVNFSSGTGDVTLALDNSGRIETHDVGGTAVAVTSGLEPDVGQTNGIQIVNSGIIRANGGGETNAVSYLSSIPVTTLASAIQVYTSTVTRATIANAQGGVIEATGDKSSAILGFAALDIDNAGEINGAAGSTLAANDQLAVFSGTTHLSGAIQSMFGFADTLANSGTIRGDIDLNGGDDNIVNSGTIIGDIFLGDGDDSFTQFANATVQGIVDAGAGNDSLIVNAAGGGTVDAGQFLHFERFQQVGEGSVSYTGTFAFDTIGLNGSTIVVAAGDALSSAGPVTVTGGAGDDSVLNNGTITGSLDLGGGADAVVNAGQIGAPVLLGAGDDSFTERAGSTVTGGVDGGAGTDIYRVVLTGDRTGIGANSGFEQLGVEGTGTLTLTLSQPFDLVSVSGAGLNIDAGSYGVGRILASDRSETVTVTGTVGLIDLGSGSNHLDISIGGRVTGDVIAGTGSDVATNSGAIAGNLFAGGGNDRVTLSGSVGGDVDMGSGDDELLLQGTWAIDGSASGGDGNDVVRAAFTGADATPQIVDFSRFAAFEALQVQSGTGAIDGTANFAAINVDGGRLIGRAGSTINGNLTVAKGATFGSAGTVNGNISVSGTLSPGASPGTMKVNGNVVLNAGSTTLLEFTPTVSDAIVINGSLNIAEGAKLTMTGERPLTPGIYTLVSASDGIAGSFGANVMRDDSIQGVLAYTASTIDLIGLFLLHDGASPQVRHTNDYLNSLLIGGDATSGIVAAFPALLGADGYANPAALSTLSPEPYASAAQMGIENGLAISAALRTVRLAGLNDEGGPFVFGQAYGHWRDFAADGRGVANADVSGNGYLGGVGYGNSTLGAALFAGRGHSAQHSRGIGAQSDADGLFFGARFHYSAGSLSAGASIVLDRADATTRRNPAVGGAARGHYDLHGVTVDGWVSYDLAIAGDWQLGPQLGVTQVSVKRDAALETGGGAFALDVAGQRYDATFLTADLKLEAPGTARLRPWATIGARYRLDSDAISATASFVGVPTSYTVWGASRKKMLPHMAAGMDIQIGNHLSLFMNGDMEFSGGNAARRANVGMNVKF